jgi:hypothetical protein
MRKCLKLDPTRVIIYNIANKGIFFSRVLVVL